MDGFVFQPDEKITDPFYSSDPFGGGQPEGIWFHWTRLPDEEWQKIAALPIAKNKCLVAFLCNQGESPIAWSGSLKEHNINPAQIVVAQGVGPQPHTEISRVVGVTTLKNAIAVSKYPAFCAVRILSEKDQEGPSVVLLGVSSEALKVSRFLRERADAYETKRFWEKKAEEASKQSLGKVGPVRPYSLVPKDSILRLYRPQEAL